MSASMHCCTRERLPRSRGGSSWANICVALLFFSMSVAPSQWRVFRPKPNEEMTGADPHPDGMRNMQYVLNLKGKKAVATPNWRDRYGCLTLLLVLWPKWNMKLMSPGSVKGWNMYVCSASIHEGDMSFMDVIKNCSLEQECSLHRAIDVLFGFAV